MPSWELFGTSSLTPCGVLSNARALRAHGARAHGPAEMQPSAPAGSRHQLRFENNAPLLDLSAVRREGNAEDRARERPGTAEGALPATVSHRIGS
ncbi:hypothetical protein NDU88_004622 [Pleurodeles waltl]|uniref:Uncharacterized protein n=1 Tax=Pleurodeles waltl TaxID=8319 RepID=A0AAV7UIP0_PLEWA|nr:hypothetical protein NDU88_004622 [Pleurodeles waltl]